MRLNNMEQRLSELEAKWMNGTITSVEAQEYANWYNQGQDDSVEIPESFVFSKENHRKRILHSIQRKRNPSVPVYMKWVSYGIAASIVTAMLSFAFWHFYPVNLEKFPVAKIRNPAFKNDILPGISKATLTLNDGTNLILLGNANGFTATQGDAKIVNKEGSLSYNIPLGIKYSNTYNILTTQRGEQYIITLSDGTKVWLNALSSIRFPVVFNDSCREVEITGEAYFEVAHNPEKPFRVRVNGMEVEVLGTHFNLNAYEDEPVIKTTLLEGSVKINHQTILAPGQQSQYERGGVVKIVNKVNVDQEVAWKNGLFNFDSCDIVAVMRQVEKWYNIKVVYTGRKTGDLFSGSIPRNANLTELLEILQWSRVHFKLEERTLTVLP